jgi:hypothetical protein
MVGGAGQRTLGGLFFKKKMDLFHNSGVIKDK